MRLGVYELRILRLAAAQPGVRAARVNDGLAGGFAPPEQRRIPNNMRAGIVFALRSEGLLEKHKSYRPGLYITDAGKLALERLEVKDA